MGSQSDIFTLFSQRGRKGSGNSISTSSLYPEKLALRLLFLPFPPLGTSHFPRRGTRRAPATLLSSVSLVVCVQTLQGGQDEMGKKDKEISAKVTRVCDTPGLVTGCTRRQGPQRGPDAAVPEKQRTRSSTC
jgi:hypothetical protein